MQGSSSRESMKKRPNQATSGRGPGGYLCPCCGPHPKHRDVYRRIERSKSKAAWKKEVR